MDTLSALLIAFSAFFFFILIFALVVYVFTALSLFTMAKNKGIDHAWFAWIPFLASYLQGELIDDVVPFFTPTTLIPQAKWGLLGASILTAALSNVDKLGWVVFAAAMVYYFLALYRLYKLYDPNHSTVFIVLSIIFNITIPFFLFAIRNNEPVEYLPDMPNA